MQSQVTLSLLNSVDFADGEDNAIEYRNIFLLGAQGSGKTTTAQVLAWRLGQKYGIANTVFAIQVAGIDRLLNVPTKVPGRCWLFAAEDITLAKIPKTDLNRFFQIRHLIQQYTGLREGMAVTMFNSHTFHGPDKNLRDTFNALIIKSVPTNPYDRGILKRYFNWVVTGSVRKRMDRGQVFGMDTRTQSRGLGDDQPCPKRLDPERHCSALAMVEPVWFWGPVKCLRLDIPA